jgi:hypothetical protein
MVLVDLLSCAHVARADVAIFVRKKLVADVFRTSVRERNQMLNCPFVFGDWFGTVKAIVTVPFSDCTVQHRIHVKAAFSSWNCTPLARWVVEFTPSLQTLANQRTLLIGASFTIQDANPLAGPETYDLILVCRTKNFSASFVQPFLELFSYSFSLPACWDCVHSYLSNRSRRM